MLLRFPAALPVDNRLGMSLFGSALIHLLVILGLGFTLPRLRSHEGLPTLEITLVQTHTTKAPVDPDFLAQARQDGGGDSHKRDIARSPLPARELGEQRLRLPTLAPAPQPEVPARRDTPDLFSQDAKTKIARPEPQPPRKILQQTQPNPGLVTRAQRDAERAQLNAEISREWQTFQGRPRHKYVNARTQEYRYALYMDAWRAKVERIGNLNYPEEAKRRHLTGSLVLDVALKADGTVASIFSGNPTTSACGRHSST
ncbi:MAG: energy transducer TonB, partial [Pseudomonadota bacterium]